MVLVQRRGQRVDGPNSDSGSDSRSKSAGSYGYAGNRSVKRTPLKSLISYGDGYTSTSTALSPVSSPSPESCSGPKFTFDDDEKKGRSGTNNSRQQPLSYSTAGVMDPTPRSRTVSILWNAIKVGAGILVLVLLCKALSSETSSSASSWVHPFGRVNPQAKLDQVTTTRTVTGSTGTTPPSQRKRPVSLPKATVITESSTISGSGRVIATKAQNIHMHIQQESRRAVIKE